ncbi:exonuclease 3'-5' domain-containing protein 2-like isoform X1 [Liolophura sinensis]|uniref:exonuclease 3'-5' domain-containing protein 2-like isoform X1 n=1 Tax=Liolophura sinensis TaxID=3198878 RepID=UPI0031583522
MTSSLQVLSRYLTVFVTGGITAFVIARGLQKLITVSLTPKAFIKRKEKICLVTSLDEWQSIYPELSEACTSVRVVGLDCEWVPAQDGDVQRPVALLQIACHTGLCILIRLCKFPDFLPPTLSAFLADRSILKAGVGVKEDGSKLLKDYGIVLRGCVDLRHVLNRVRGIYKIRSPGLKGLSKSVLNITLDKSIFIRCGNWEADVLTPEQVKYAALDASVGVDIFLHLIVAKMTACKPTGSSLQKIYEPGFWKRTLSVCQGVVDVAYSYKQDRLLDSDGVGETSGKSRAKSVDVGEMSAAVRSYSTRQSPLYHNCKLQAPDGQQLCTCDEKKANWYIEKELGEKVCDDPLTVRLYFEPSGRPDSGRNYYLQDKENICVVCGHSNTYIRKIIVPHEYRKFFPFMMKEHSSHDVLLLCPPCHAKSSQYDSLLRQQLADRCDAPLDSGTGTRMRQDSDLHKVKSAAKALKQSRDKLPADRREVLEHTVKTHFGVMSLTEELLEKALDLDTRIYNSKYVPHGQKVVEYIRQREGLVSFEKMWRQHFLDTMNPQFLPLYWSVDHNHERLAQFDDQTSDHKC